MKTISRRKLLEYFDYNKETGVLTRIRASKFAVITKPNGYVNSHGYVIFRIDSELFSAHRMIYFLETGRWPKCIDHINGIKTDNRIKNLRECTKRENNSNLARHRKGRLVGAHYNKGNRKWHGKIVVKKKTIYLGSFDTEQEAHNAYVKKANEIDQLNQKEAK